MPETFLSYSLLYGIYTVSAFSVDYILSTAYNTTVQKFICSCQKCNGKGLIPCATCGSRGLIKCETCQGGGSLLTRQVGIVRWYVYQYIMHIYA